MKFFRNFKNVARKLVYFFITIIELRKILFRKKVVFLDLDYTLCDNKFINRNHNQVCKPDYMYDIPVNNKILTKIKKFNEFNVVILSARGIKSINKSNKWLVKNNFHKELKIFVGDPWMKLIPIIYCILTNKETVLIDDLTYDGVKAHPVKNIIIDKFDKKLNYIDSLNI